jgi:2-(1,2-epoxy-1,2-dihydrophenyl)acetyl-CoA isomerase
MGDGDLVKLTITSGVADVLLNRPGQLNAINCELAEQLVAVLARIETDPAIKVVVLRGAGRAFMAGGDLSDFHAAGDRAPEAVSRLIAPFHEIIRSIRRMPAPVIAAVHGPVAGGGLALALACDFVIAAADAVFTPAYLRIATNPDGATTWSVTKLLGERRALEWLMLGDPMKAEQAAALGLINRVVAIDAFAAETETFAARLAKGPALAQASLKRLIWRASAALLDSQLEAEREGFMALAATPDFREGIASFFEGRKPRFGTSGD